MAGTLGQGGAERQLYYMLKCLKEAGSEVTLLSLTKSEYWEEPIRELGVPVEWVGQSSSRLARLVYIVKTVSRLKPQVVQSQHFYTNGYAALAARWCGCRAVGALRNDVFSEMRDCGRLMGRLCLALPNRLVANSRAALRNLGALGCRRARVNYLPNVIDLKQFSFEEGRRDGPFTLLGVGRLVRQKRFDRFLGVLRLVQEQSVAPVRARIVGDGPLRPELEKAAHRLALRPETVEFCGRVVDMLQVYRAADVLLLTSDHEGSPNVVLEAMACGLPVIATGVGDVPELIQDEVTGFTCEAADEAGMACRAGRLLNNRALARAIGVQARTWVEKSRAVASLPLRLANLYAGLLAGKSGNNMDQSCEGLTSAAIHEVP